MASTCGTDAEAPAPNARWGTRGTFSRRAPPAQQASLPIVSTLGYNVKCVLDPPEAGRIRPIQK